MAGRFVAPKVLFYIGGLLIIMGAIFTLAISGIGIMSWSMFRMGIFAGALGIMGLLFGLLVLVAASMIGKRHSSNELWLVIALVASIMSMLDGGGFIIGAILAFIGSIIGLIEIDVR